MVQWKNKDKGFLFIKKRFSKNPKSNLLLKIVHFSRHLVLGIYVKNYLYTRNICRNRVRTKYIQ